MKAAVKLFFTIVTLAVSMFFGCGESIDNQLKSAKQSYNQGDFKQSIAICEKVLKDNPNKDQVQGVNRVISNSKAELDYMLALEIARKDELHASKIIDSLGEIHKQSDLETR